MIQVEHPSYYNAGAHEVIDVINEHKLNFNMGNAVKYMARAGRKDDYATDLKKAVFYLQYQTNRNCRMFGHYDQSQSDELCKEWGLSERVGKALDCVLLASAGKNVRELLFISIEQLQAEIKEKTDVK